MKAENRAVWALGIVICLLAGSIIFQLVINAANDQQDRNIRESQFRACVINGNTLRDQVRREFVDLKRKILIPSAERNRELYSAVAGLSDSASVVSVLEQAAAAEAAQIGYLKMRIKTIRERLPDVVCRKVYPPLDGQTFPRIRVPADAVEGRRPEDSHRANSEGGGDDQTSEPSSPQQPPGGSQGSPGPETQPPPDHTPPSPGPGQDNPPPDEPPQDNSILNIDPTADCPVRVTSVEVCVERQP